MYHLQSLSLSCERDRMLQSNFEQILDWSLFGNFAQEMNEICYPQRALGYQNLYLPIKNSKTASNLEVRVCSIVPIFCNGTV